MDDQMMTAESFNDSFSRRCSQVKPPFHPHLNHHQPIIHTSRFIHQDIVSSAYIRERNIPPATHPSSMSDPIDRHISSPSELANLTSASTTTPQTIHLHLLAPLSEPETLAKCLENVHGPFQSLHRYLDFSPLSKRWRTAWAAVPATAVDTVVFDLVPPEPTAAAPTAPAVQQVYWTTKIPGDEGIGVIEMDAIRLVMTMATTMSMRSRMRVVFGVTGDVHLNGPTRGGFKELIRIVEGLSGKVQEEGEEFVMV